MSIALAMSASSRGWTTCITAATTPQPRFPSAKRDALPAPRSHGAAADATEASRASGADRPAVAPVRAGGRDHPPGLPRAASPGPLPTALHILVPRRRVAHRWLLSPLASVSDDTLPMAHDIS